MRWVEYVVMGVVGGAVGAVSIGLLAYEGPILEGLSAGLLAFANNIVLIILAVVFGWMGGRFSQSGLGAFLGGVGAPLVLVALRLAF